ncbi:GntR family transcriptional regulator [Actinacidiphila glaucinigra]|uniref:GntR family transcriptional regulator n=1 Tax=Actinacidiphila glaucinigra TaxID=235986 RepID=UPI002DDA642B|nr:GntR family transcriptional regulator [Actinacidiphila glaucinigra]WSD63351.1 GntR family transcriptional regulator [Actinacidiphila glaucinigra]
MAAEVDPAVLAGDRALLARSSTADRVAAVLRTRISEGHLPPGGKLAEDVVAGALGVSRNTLREAFRLLTHEKLLVHELNRGVFVRVLTAGDVCDIYRVRRLVECSVIRGLGPAPYDLTGAANAVAEGGRAAAGERWGELGTADIHFHQALVDLAGSARLTGLMTGVLAELRLAFHAMDDPRAFHEPYLDGNREILSALEAADPAKAESLLASYLDQAEAQLVRRYALPAADGGGPR